jgi:hypothetical protein
LVLHSGEIPEVTFREALYHLREDAEGPCLQLNSDDGLPLKQAVVNRYRAIILADDKILHKGENGFFSNKDRNSRSTAMFFATGNS